jgi:uncharacterized protein
VRLPDANVLLYALDDTSARHTGAREWLDTALSGNEEVAFAWVVLLAVLRLTTKSAVFTSPLTPGEAFDVVDGWLAQPCAVLVHPTPRHASLLRGLVSSAGTAGNLTTDAHLAALSLEYGATVCSYDADFSRFPGISVVTPERDL